MTGALFLIAALGLVLSVYTLYVEHQLKNNSSFKAVCDIGENMSCTKAFTSPYGRIAGISNAFLGLLFYVLVAVLAWLGQKNFILLLALFSVLGSAYLAYLQYGKLKNFCLVCTLIYVVNVALLVAILVA